jgi:hypothetical protein
VAKNTHDILADIVSHVKCKPGWRFSLRDEDGALRLVIYVPGHDSAAPSDLKPLAINHLFPVPTATYNKESWRRWVFEMCRCVEDHELGEWFRIDAERCFAPLHGPGEDPYTVHEFRPVQDQLTTQDGSMRLTYGE